MPYCIQLSCSKIFMKNETGKIWPNNSDKTITDFICSRLSAVEADGYQVSRPLAACNDFIPTACVRNMRTWGGPGTSIWTWAKRGGHGPHGEDLDGVWQRAKQSACQEGRNLHLLHSSPGPSTCTWRELETGPYNTAKSGWGPHDWSMLSPTAVHRDRELLHSTLDPSLRAYVGLEGGARTWRLNTGPPMGGRKWTGATRQERAEPHGQFTGIDDFIARAASTVGPRGPHQGHQHTRTILVLAWRYWTVCKRSRIDLSRPHQAV